MARMRYAFLSGIATIVFVVVAYTQAWYQIQQQSSFGTYNTYFYWTQLTTVSPNGQSKTESYSSISYTHVAQTMNTILSFLTIGGAIAVGLVVGQFILLCCCDSWSKVDRMWKMLLVLASLAVTAMLCVAFFTLFNITQSFKQDGACGFLGFDANTLYCQSFRGSQSGTFGSVFWTPYNGWWLCLAAIVCSLLSSAGTFASHR